MPGAKNTQRPQVGLLQRLCPMDETVNIKLLMRVWGPRLEFIVRLMLVATFLDDSLRTTMHFSQLTEMIYVQGFPTFLAAMALGMGLLSQLIGSFCLLAIIQPDVATKALIAWTIAQQILFRQFSNFEFFAGSFSLIGGLLMLRAHLVSDQDRHGVGARTQLLGRMLLPATYLYQAGRLFVSSITLDETNSFGAYLSDLSMFAVNTLVFVGLAIGCTLVATGLRSRTVAFLLAIVNIGFTCYQHPFFLLLQREDGEWKIDESAPWMWHITLPDNVSPNDVDLWEVYDLHRYYFFLGLSTSGALMLLTQFGPGEIAAQKNEVLIPVYQRADE